MATVTSQGTSPHGAVIRGDSSSAAPVRTWTAAMAFMDIFFNLLQILTLNVQSVGYELDKETRERMEQRAEMLERKRTVLWQEVEEMWQKQRNWEQSGFAWASKLLSALQHWQCWAIAGVLVLLFGLCWWLGKRSREPERQNESSDSKHIQRPVQHQDRDYGAVKNLVENLLSLFNLDYSWYPMLQKAIKVGSAFEGWSPREGDITYRLLVPLKPPCGHIFHLEPVPGWPTRNFRIRVELVCTCETEQLAGQTRCFLHDPEEEGRRQEGPSILHNLCTDSYLDVRKTAQWFQKVVRRFWKFLPESATHRLTVLPSDRSCKFCVTQGSRKKFLIELMFGVQEGDSDIFLSSQSTEAAYNPNTMWPESYAVAEMKFFGHIASQAQPDSVHLQCLQLCARSLLGTELSTHTLKTIVMQLLSTIPLSDWGEDILMERLEDILQYLQSCLEERCLNHFFIGNDNVPEEIILPLQLRTAEPLNLFQHLAQDSDAYEDAWLDFLVLRRRLRRVVHHEHWKRFSCT